MTGPAALALLAVLALVGVGGFVLWLVLGRVRDYLTRLGRQDFPEIGG